MKFAGAGVVGSKEKLKESLEASSGDQIWIKQIPSDGEMTVRFLQEMDSWFEFREHWGDSVKSYFACVGKDNDCPGCNGATEQDQRTSKRYLVNALDVETGRVIPLKLPVDLVNRLETRWDRYETITDRDYLLSRTGKGLNTTYDLDPQSPDALDVSRYEDQLHDPQEILEKQWSDAWENNDKPKATTASKPDVAEDTDIEDEVELTESDIRNMKVAELEEVCEKLGIDVDPDWRKADLVDAILAQAE